MPITPTRAKELYDKLSPFLVTYVTKSYKAAGFHWQGLKLNNSARHLTFAEFYNVYLKQKFNMEVNWDV